MSREEKDLYNLHEADSEEERVEDEGGAGDDDNIENHVGYHNFYGY